MIVRPMRLDDAATVAELTTQLGYPVEPDELRERVAALLACPDEGALFVADDDEPIGWIHVERRLTLETSPAVQVMGLVVHEGHRSGGIGRQLLEAGEAWARERGIGRMLVGTRTTRIEAHRFYERQGYTIWKTSYFMQKALRNEPS